MRTYILLIGLIVGSINLNAQTVPVVDYTELEQIWNNKSDTVYLINFWATWCRPCVEEMPDFIKLEQELKNEKFRMVLVSLDFSTQIEKRLMPFLKNKNISSEVIVLDDDPNIWINRVNKDWDGNIPVTLVVKQAKADFYGHSLHYKELSNIVKPKLK